MSASAKRPSPILSHPRSLPFAPRFTSGAGESRAHGGLLGGRHGACAGLGTVVVSMALMSFAWAAPAGAAVPVQLGTAAPFAVLAGTAVTDVPTSAITGDVGLSPAAGSNYAGLTSAEVTGTIYATDATGPGGSVNDPALLTTAKNDLTTAFVSAAGEPTTTTFTTGDNQLGGQTLTGGVYAFGHATTANISAASPLTLNGQGDETRSSCSRRPPTWSPPPTAWYNSRTAPRPATSSGRSGARRPSTPRPPSSGPSWPSRRPASSRRPRCRVGSWPVTVP